MPLLFHTLNSFCPLNLSIFCCRFTVFSSEHSFPLFLYQQRIWKPYILFLPVPVINVVNSCGLRIDPCGIPQVTFVQSEKAPFISTLFTIHSNAVPSIPWGFNLCISHVALVKWFLEIWIHSIYRQPAINSPCNIFKLELYTTWKRNLPIQPLITTQTL